MGVELGKQELGKQELKEGLKEGSIHLGQRLFNV